MSSCQVSTLWLIFTVLFLCMAWRECRKSRQELESLKQANFSSGSVKLINVNFEDFAKELNKANQESHKIAATSYFLAGLTALASFIFSIFSF